jgi:hypothetical protein
LPSVFIVASSRRDHLERTLKAYAQPTEPSSPPLLPGGPDLDRFRCRTMRSDGVPPLAGSLVSAVLVHGPHHGLSLRDGSDSLASARPSGCIVRGQRPNNEKCMYSAVSMWPRSLSAAARRVASNPNGSLFDFLLALAIGVVSPLGETPIRAGP